MKFIRNSNPGYNRDLVLNLSLQGNFNLETFKNELLTHPNIKKAAYSSRIPTGRLADAGRSRVFLGDSAVSTNFRLPVVAVDRDFLDTYEIDLAAGENFREGMETSILNDSTTVGYYIINETAAKAFGYNDPNEIIGFKIEYASSAGRIIGVMNDFHFESLHSTIVPTLIMYRERYRSISMKLDGDNIRNTLDYIENTYAKFDTENTANYTFLDELFNNQYRQEERLSSMIKVFAVIAILIGCLGLVGMVGFIIETKLKEIGIRKVLGASTQSIWMLVSNRFMILVGIAFLIALPISYYLMDGWLEEFVYRTTITIFLIVLPIVLAIALTLLAISYQTMKATLVNPVECLKDE